MLPHYSSSDSCHICQSKTLSLGDKQCTNKPHCTNKYCTECIKKYFNQQNPTDKHDPSIWKCYSCQNMCQCMKCNTTQSPNMVLSQYQPKQQNDINGNKIQTKQPHEIKGQVNNVFHFNISDKNRSKVKIIEIIDLNQSSQDCITASFLKGMQNSSLHSTSQIKHQEIGSAFDRFKEDSFTPLDCSSQMQGIPQRKSKTIKKSKKQRNLVGARVQKLPPYLQSIMRRKQTFINFMVRHSKKTYEQLVKEEMDGIKQNIKSQPCVQRVQLPSPVGKIEYFNPNAVIDLIMSPPRIPNTPSFVPVSEPLTPISSGLKITDLLNEKLKEYEMEDDDLSIELI